MDPWVKPGDDKSKMEENTMGQAMGTFLYYVFIAPVWKLSGWLAGYFFPYEDDRRHIALALLLSLLIFTGIAYLYFWFFA